MHNLLSACFTDSTRGYYLFRGRKVTLFELRNKFRLIYFLLPHPTFLPYMPFPHLLSTLLCMVASKNDELWNTPAASSEPIGYLSTRQCKQKLQNSPIIQL